MGQLVPVFCPMKTAVYYIIDLLLCSDNSIKEHLVMFRFIKLAPDSIQHQSTPAVKGIEVDPEELTVLPCLLALVYYLES